MPVTFAEALRRRLSGLDAESRRVISAAAILGRRFDWGLLAAVTGLPDDAVVRALGRYGEAIGLAFQIADDVLDVTQTTAQLGKTAGSDLALHKSTYPALLGVDGAVSRARALVDDACETLQDAGLLTPTLEHLARYIVARQF